MIILGRSACLPAAEPPPLRVGGVAAATLPGVWPPKGAKWHPHGDCNGSSAAAAAAAVAATAVAADGGSVAAATVTDVPMHGRLSAKNARQGCAAAHGSMCTVQYNAPPHHRPFGDGGVDSAIASGTVTASALWVLCTKGSDARRAAQRIRPLLSPVLPPRILTATVLPIHTYPMWRRPVGHPLAVGSPCSSPLAELGGPPAWPAMHGRARPHPRRVPQRGHHGRGCGCRPPRAPPPRRTRCTPSLAVPTAPTPP